MTLEDLKSCRKVAQKLFGLQHELRVMKKSAGYIRSVSYADTPRPRGEPLSPEQAHVEKCEEKEIEIATVKPIWLRKKDAIVREMRANNLTRLQKELLIGYYIYGANWDVVNEKCHASREQSKYQVRLAFEKLFKNT